MLYKVEKYVVILLSVMIVRKDCLKIFLSSWDVKFFFFGLV